MRDFEDIEESFGSGKRSPPAAEGLRARRWSMGRGKWGAGVEQVDSGRENWSGRLRGIGCCCSGAGR